MSAQGIINVKVLGDFSDIARGAKNLQSYLNGLKLPANMSARFSQSLTDLQTKAKDLQEKFSQGFETKADFSNATKSAKEMLSLIDTITKDLKNIGRSDLANAIDMDTTEMKNATQQVENLKKSITEISANKGLKLSLEDSGLDKFIAKSEKAKQMFKNFSLKIEEGDIAGAAQELGKLEKYAKNLSASKKNIEDFTNTITNLKTDLGTLETEMQSLPEGTRNAVQEFLKLKDLSLDNLEGELKTAISEQEQLSNSAKNLAKDELEAAQNTMKLSSELSNLKTSANYFFGLQNMFQLLKRGVRDAIDTIKELDATMTETAVVTDFSVGDMWKMMPEYTKQANELGVAVNDLYKATTLYYQQGLNTEQAMGLATETLKMGRIGGLEAAEATDMMTAALRGFNMEINEASAQRINDVYSNLAANTASNTRELGEAMEKTASIAHSANMDFETTSAFLAQMIETTREAPENLGTAMKTIIARFQEIKNDPYGVSEVEGEEVSFNRVDKALQSVGITLAESRDKFRDLDDVFLELASKWDTLSQTQQRYVATMAAGSRQQSRFIAMMSNYDRTMQLVGFANDSAGASNVQFSKTLESVEAKFQKFKNAWDQFLMGITNNELVKTITEIGTGFFELINKLINGLSGGSGLIKSVLSLATAFAGLRTGGKLVNKLLGGFGAAIDPKSEGGFLSGFRGGLAGRKNETNAQQAALINRPIVGVLEQILGVISGGKLNQKIDDKNGIGLTALKGQYKEINKLLSGNSFKYSDIAAKMQGMSAEEQAYIYRNNPALKGSLRTSMFNMLTGGNTELSKLDKLKYGKWVSELEKYAQNSNTKLNFSDLMNPNNRESQFAITKALTNIDPSGIGKIYQENLEKAQKSLISSKNFLNQEEYDKLIEKTALTKTHSQMGIDFTEMFKPQELTGADKIAQGFGKVGAAAQGAGMAIQGVGQALSAAGLGTAGAMVSGLGSAFMSLGGVVSGVGSAISSIKDLADDGIIPSVSSLAGPLAGVGLIIGTITIATQLWQKHIEEVNEAAKEVAENYKNAQEETSKNISTLEGYREEYARLSQGVDKNGNNVSLGTEEYQDYLRITNEIAAISPELVKGYNSEGNAILDKNKALERSIELQKEEQKLAKEEYTNMRAMKATQEAMDLDENYKLMSNKNYEYWNAENKDSQLLSEAKKTAKLIRDAGGEDILKAYGINPDDIENMTQETMRLLDQHGAEINSRVERELKDIDESELTKINDSMAEFGSDYQKFRESYSELLSQMTLRAADEGMFDDINDEFQSILNSAIESTVADTDLSVEEKWSQIQDFHDKLKNLDFGDVEGLETFKNEYQDALDEVTQAQEDFDSNLDSNAYNEAVEDRLQQIKEWAAAAEEEYEKTGDKQYQLLHESLTNQAALIESYSKQNAIAMTDAFNTLSDVIDAAEGAYEAFQQKIEGGDYYTAAENITKIIDEVINADDVDRQGKGSQTFWAAGEATLGRENLFNPDGTLKSVDQVVSEMSVIKDTLVPGVEGANATMTRLATLSEKEGSLMDKYFDYNRETGELTSTKDLAEISQEELKALATEWGGSVDSFVAAMNNASQHYDISFANIEGIVNGLKSSESTLSGKSENIYATRDMFEAQAEAAGLSLDKIVEIEQDLSSKGVVLLPSADELTGKEMGKYFKDWGLETTKGNKYAQKDLIKYLSKLGYGQEDVEQILNTAREDKLVEGTAEDFKEDWEKAQQELSDPTLSSINDYAGGILSEVEAIRIGMGILTSEDIERAKQDKEKIEGKEGIDTAEEQAGAGLVNGKWAAEASKEEYRETHQMLEDQLKYTEEMLDITNNWGDEKTWTQDQKDYRDYYEKRKSGLEEDITNLETARKTSYNDLTLQQKSDFAAAQSGQSEEALFNFIKQNEKDLVDLSQGEFEEVIKSWGKTAENFDNSLNKIRSNKDYLDTTDVSKAKEGESLKDYTARINTVTGTNQGTEALEMINEAFPEGKTEEEKKLILQALMSGDDEELSTLLRKEDYEKIIKVRTEYEGGKKFNELAGNVGVSIKANENDFYSKYKKVKSAKDDIKKGVKTPITADASDAINDINQVQTGLNLINGTTAHATVTGTVDAGFEATLDRINQKLEKIKAGRGASGINNTIHTSSIPSVGSLASGTKKGLNGPNGKGGLTLTGEKGYEIGWLPSEGRAMILGARGPQMTNLPPDAVVWNHEQSKKIMKQKAIPLGSMAYSIGVKANIKDLMEGISASSEIYGSASNSSTGSGNSGGKGSNTSKQTSKDGKQEKEIIKLKNFSVYVFNMTQKIEQVQRKIEERQRTINKLLEKAYITINDVTQTMGQEVAYIKQSITLNKDLEKYYTKQLKKLDAGKLGRETIKWSNTKKTKGKDDANWSTGSKSHKASINLGKYIIYDPSTGAYMVDQKQISKVAKSKSLGGYNKAKAIAEAAQKKIEEFTSGRDKASDAIRDAEDKLQELAKQVYDVFYGWENELTKIYNLTQQISQLDKQRDRYSGLSGLRDAILESGLSEVADMTSKDLIESGTAFRGEINNLINSITSGSELIAANRESVNALVNNDKDRKELAIAKQQKKDAEKAAAEQKKTLKKVKKNGATAKKARAALEKANGEILAAEYRIQQAEDRIKVREKANKYITTTRNGDGTVSLDINVDQLEEDRLSGKIAQTEYDAIKKLAEDTQKASEDLIAAYQEEANKLTELYSTLQDLKDKYADYAKDLREWLADYEEKEIDKLDKLGDSLDKALKDMLDEVKKRLDQRRQQEENLQTETDIANKQRQLAALRADSSGSNAKRIKELEKDIADSQKKYTQTLEDQTLQRLQDQADEASKQREKQIELLKAQLEWNKASGLFARQVEAILANPDSAENQELLWKYFKDTNNWGQLTEQEKNSIIGNFDVMVADLNLTTGIPSQITQVQDGIRKSNEYLKSISNVMIKNSGTSAEEFLNTTDKNGNKIYSPTDAKNAGYTAAELREAGVSLQELAETGYDASSMREAGATAPELQDFGYNDEEILGAGYSTGDLLKAGYTGKQINSSTGAKTSEIEAAVAENIDDPNVDKTDLAGLKRTIDINGKKKGGEVSGSYNETGTRVVAASGSTLYYFNPDTGKISNKIPISKLTEDKVNGNKQEAAKAIKYALTHSKVGSLLNKDMPGLIRAAGLNGEDNTIKLANGRTASIGENGSIYYDSAKTKSKKSRVYRWDPSKKNSVKEIKGNNSKYISYAKKNNDISREFAQALINNGAYKKKTLQDKYGVTKFATGGLASYTGPAWLDGTPSKPELVLNAQDTKNFLQLKDVLSRAVSNSSGALGDMNMTYDIDINVDHISNDYDVDQIANRVKRQIVQSASYRNVNAIRNIR